MNKAKLNLTEGNLPLQIFFFTVPLICSYYIQQMYNAADLVFAGNFLGKNASAAIGASALLVNCMIGLFIGLSVGVSIIYGRSIGARQTGVKQHIFEASIVISVAGGGLLTVIGYASSEFLLKILRTPIEILPIAKDFLQIYFFCLIPMVLYNMISGMIRASGNSRMPMIAQIISGSLNIALDALFVVVLDMGIKSLAMATLIAQSTAALLVLILYLKGESEIDRRTLFRNMNVPLIKKILSLGLPVGLQNMLMTLSNIFIQYNINQLGVDTMAAFSNYGKIESLIYYPMLAFGQATLYFISQNLGAQKTDRVKKTIRISIAMGLMVVIPIEFMLLYFGDFFFEIFNPDPDVIAVGLKIIGVTFPFYWLYVFVEVWSYAIRAMGRTTQAMLMTFFNFAIMRVVLLIVFSGLQGEKIRYVASIYPITWLLAVICFGVYWYRLKGRIGSKEG